MPLVKDENSYGTIEEADAYFETRLDVAAWVEANALTKAAALVTATSLLDDESWAGTIASESQKLAFPRVMEYFDPRAGLHLRLDGSIVPDRIVNATFEMAYHLLNNDGLLDATGKVENLKVATIQLTDIESAPQMPNHVYRSIKPLLKNAGSSSWWRAN